MPKPACVKCRRFYRMKRSGFYLTEGMPVGDNVAPGTSEPESWRPYKIWAADLWECQGCGNQIVSGYGQGPVSIHHEKDFADKHLRLNAGQFQINDC